MVYLTFLLHFADGAYRAYTPSVAQRTIVMAVTDSLLWDYSLNLSLRDYFPPVSQR